MNFQYAVAPICRIPACKVLLGQVLPTLCFLALPVGFAQPQRTQTHPELPSGLDSYLTQMDLRTPQIRTMSPGVDLPGNPGNGRQSQDRTVSAVAPLQNDVLSELPNDPRRDQQWNFFEPRHYKGASALFAAQQHNSGNFPVVVAVVDSGVVPSHEDLELLPGYDFISDKRVANDGDGRDSDASDPGDWVTAREIAEDPVSSGCSATRSKWHGTAVSGIIGAISGNQRGIIGGAPSVLLVPVRVTGKCGGYIRDLVDGVRWAAGLPVPGAPQNSAPARVINLSVGFAGACPIALQQAIDAAVGAGAVVVAAATNSGTVLDIDPQSPASCSNVTTVGALLRDGSLASYSATGSALTLLAPGGSVDDGILTTQNISGTSPVDASSYGYHFGTSMAAAHVSATFAMLLSIDPALTNSALNQLVRQSASGAAEISGCTALICGAGRLNAKAAVDLLLTSSASQSPDQPLQDDFSVSTLSSVTQPPFAAANDTSTSASPANSGIGRFDLSTVLLMFALAVLSNHRRQSRHDCA